MNRIVQGMNITDVLKTVRETDGYFITNTARDLSQSDFKNRILLHTDLLAAEAREKAGFFSLEITGGASVHVDILRKQVDPFLKLKLLREAMPTTMFQTLCRGVNLFGYRPYQVPCGPGAESLLPSVLWSAQTGAAGHGPGLQFHAGLLQALCCFVQAAGSVPAACPQFSADELFPR